MTLTSSDFGMKSCHSIWCSCDRRQQAHVNLNIILLHQEGFAKRGHGNERGAGRGD